jgi:hypothetical protein
MGGGFEKNTGSAGEIGEQGHRITADSSVIQQNAKRMNLAAAAFLHPASAKD